MIHSMISRQFWGSLLLTSTHKLFIGADDSGCITLFNLTWINLKRFVGWSGVIYWICNGLSREAWGKVQELSFINTSNKTFQASNLRLVLQSVTPQLHPLACRQACLLATGFWPWPMTCSRSKCCDLTLWDADSPKNFILLTSFEPSWEVKSIKKWKKLLPVKGHGLCSKWTGLRYQLFWFEAAELV